MIIVCGLPSSRVFVMTVMRGRGGCCGGVTDFLVTVMVASGGDVGLVGRENWGSNLTGKPRLAALRGGGGGSGATALCSEFAAAVSLACGRWEGRERRGRRELPPLDIVSLESTGIDTNQASQNLVSICGDVIYPHLIRSQVNLMTLTEKRLLSTTSTELGNTKRPAIRGEKRHHRWTGHTIKNYKNLCAVVTAKCLNCTQVTTF